MYPYLRAAWMIYRARRLPPMGIYDTHVSYHRAWPWDTDMFGELNNGRILTLFELGRWQSTVRYGFLRYFLKNRMSFAVAGVSVRYRRRIPVFQRYRIQTRVLGYGERFIYIEQSMWQGDTPCHHMLLRAAIRDKDGTVLPRDFMERAGLEAEPRELPAWVRAWADADGERPWPP
ncbi:MAG: acyl-CoA thioesterase, partial [Pseudomonadota bacterium]